MLVRSLSGKNWQDRDKADKVSGSLPFTSKTHSISRTIGKNRKYIVKGLELDGKPRKM